MAKHAASRTVEPLPVKAGVKGVEMVRGRHRATPPTLRERRSAQVSVAPSRLSRNTSDTRTIPKAPQKPTVQYRGAHSLYTPRGPRTRYIRYLGAGEGAHTGKLVGEWLAGVLLICFAVPTQAANAGYQKTITAIMYRLTALTAVFFVLALMSNGKGGKTAVYAGLLIDFGILFNAVQSGTLTGITNIISGKSMLVGGTAPAADITTVKAFPISGGLADLSATSAHPPGSSGGPMPA